MTPTRTQLFLQLFQIACFICMIVLLVASVYFTHRAQEANRMAIEYLNQRITLLERMRGIRDDYDRAKVMTALDHIEQIDAEWKKVQEEKRYGR
jgi:biopolymer transport protein ExbB/TolQ